MSSIHSPEQPERRFFGRRDSDATWNDSDSEHGARPGDSPAATSEGFKYGRPGDTRTGSSMLLNKYSDDEQGHTYPAAAPLEKGSPTTLAAVAAAKRRRRRWILIAVALAVVILAIGLGVGLAKYFSNKNKTGGGSGANSSGGKSETGSPSVPTEAGNDAVLWGKGGDTVTMTNGTTFVYDNKLGGTWNAIPFNDTARPQADQPALNEKWDYSENRILGVNVGGWLVLEPFISPGVFEPYIDQNSSVIDEWTLSVQLGDQLAPVITKHYDTFITEADFAAIAAAGLNWVRLPVGWWMIETWDGEPFLEGVSFNYFLKALEWARKYGLRVNLDLHAVPGSQNGYNHSGKFGTINFLVGPMGVANAQRTLNYIRTLTEFISQPQYTNVVPMFSVLNEALMSAIGDAPLKEFYYEVYTMIRGISGIGEGKGPFIIVHDGFDGPGAGHLAWGGYLQGADRLGVDTHPYFCFATQNNDSMGYNTVKPCVRWGPAFNQTMTNFGFNFAGEYSLAVNDCGEFLNNIGYGNRYEGTYPTPDNPDTTNFPRVGSCDPWNDYTTWSDDTKKQFSRLMWSSQDAMRNSFFWTWRIGGSTRSNLTPNPMWSYELGLREGWIVPDARGSTGGCALVASIQGTTVPTATWANTLSAWQTGGAGAGTIVQSQAANYSTWPPPGVRVSRSASASYSLGQLPQYTPTGTVVTLKVTSTPASSLFPSGDKSTDVGAGWANPADTSSGWYVQQSGCAYPDPWVGYGGDAPAACGGGQRQAKRAPALAAPTTPPAFVRRR